VAAALPGLAVATGSDDGRGAAGWDELVVLGTGRADAGVVRADQAAELAAGADWAGADVWTGAAVEPMEGSPTPGWVAMASCAGTPRGLAPDAAVVSAVDGTAARCPWATSTPVGLPVATEDTAAGDDCLTAR